MANFWCILKTGAPADRCFVNDRNPVTILSRNARYLWLGALFVPPLTALLAYDLMPHEEIWHEVLYSILCLPIFGAWLVALLGCAISFIIYRSCAERYAHRGSPTFSVGKQQAGSKVKV